MAISHCYWHLVVKNSNFTLLLTSCGQEWQFHIATDILWSRMAISHCYWHLVVRNDNFTLLLTYCGQEWQFHIATDILWSRMAISHCYWYFVVKNGNFTLLLTCIVVKNGNFTFWILLNFLLFWIIRNGHFTLLLTSSGHPQWQFHIATDIIVGVRILLLLILADLLADSTPPVLMSSHEWIISHWLTCCGQEWQFHIATDTLWLRMGISHCYFWYISGQEISVIATDIVAVKNGNFTLLLTSFSHEWPLSHYYWHLVVTITNFNYESSYLPGVICHISTDILWSSWWQISWQLLLHQYWCLEWSRMALLLTSCGQECPFHIATDKGTWHGQDRQFHIADWHL